MTGTRKAFFTVLGYVLNILLFSLIYWILWLNNPSDFIVNEQYNEHTIKPFYDYDDLPNTNETSDKLISASDANDLIKPYYEKLSILNDSLRKVRKLLLETEKLDSINQAKLMLSFDKNFETYLTEQIMPYNKIEDSIKTIINIQKQKQKLTQVDNDSYFQYDVSIAKLEIELSKNEVALNKSKLNAYNKVLKRFSSFYNDTLNTIGHLLNAKINKLEKVKYKLLEDVRDKKEKIRSIAVDFYANRVFKLSFFDFLYFSIITASSTGYGDILPNNSTIRNLVSIEIMLSLFLFGFFFYFISQRLNEPKA
jgi:hypothetical protein